jgi:hypothetical protein
MQAPQSVPNDIILHLEASNQAAREGLSRVNLSVDRNRLPSLGFFTGIFLDLPASLEQDFGRPPVRMT